MRLQSAQGECRSTSPFLVGHWPSSDYPPNFIYGPLKTVTHSRPREAEIYEIGPTDSAGGRQAGLATKSGTMRFILLLLGGRNHAGQKVICAGGRPEIMFASFSHWLRHFDTFGLNI